MLSLDRIFQLTPNGGLMAHTEWLPDVRLRHFSTSHATYLRTYIFQQIIKWTYKCL